MPAYSFLLRFCLYVENGSKRQTVRAYRKNIPRMGQLAYLYYALRTKFTRLLTEPQKQTRVSTIWIFENGDVFIAKSYDALPKDQAERYLLKRNRKHLTTGIADQLSDIEKDCFAWCDGFRVNEHDEDDHTGCFAAMISFWKQTHTLPFTGTVTYW